MCYWIAFKLHQNILQKICYIIPTIFGENCNFEFSIYSLFDVTLKKVQNQNFLGKVRAKAKQTKLGITIGKRHPRKKTFGRKQIIFGHWKILWKNCISETVRVRNTYLTKYFIFGHVTLKKSGDSAGFTTKKNLSRKREEL